MKRTIMAGALILFGATQMSAAVLRVEPAGQSVDVGNNASVNIDISGLGNGAAPALAAYTGLLVGYDAALLTPFSVTFSNRLGDPSNPVETLLLSDVFLPSAIQLDGVSFLSASQLFAAQATPTGQFTIATIVFTAIASGTSAIDLSYSILSDENANAILADVANGSININRSGPIVIPEPSAFLLWSAGAAMLVLARRKQIG